MFDKFAYLGDLTFFLLLIGIIVVLLIIDFFRFMKIIAMKRTIYNILKNKEAVDAINDFCKSEKDGSDKKIVELVEKEHDELFKERIVIIENFKLLLLGIFIGIFSSILGAYIVHITLNGFYSLSLSALTCFVVSLVILWYMLRSLFKRYLIYNLTWEMLKNPITRNFMETIWILSTKLISEERTKNQKK